MRRVRVAAGESFAQVFARLTNAQQSLVDEVETNQDRRRASAAILARDDAVLHHSVVRALLGGVPAVMLAEQLEVSVSRVYQIRELAIHEANRLSQLR